MTTSPPTHTFKFVDKRGAENGIHGGVARLEFSTNAAWRTDPSRDRPLGYSWRMPSAELAVILDLPEMPTKAGREIIEVIAADAIVSARLYPGRRISYSRRAQHWADRARYAGPGFTRDNVVLAVEKLVENGILIDHDRRPPGKRGTQSSYLPNPTLAAFDMPPLNRRKGETLILKDADGNMVNYRETPGTRDRRYTLCRVNDVLEAADIRIDREGIVNEGRWTRIDDYLVFPDHKSLHRIYNGDWTLGGRFYGAFWQNMRSEDRRHILIDGMETVEVDYDQLHARIIYARAKKTLRADAYEIEGWDRKIAKRAFFIIVNAGNFPEAKGAVANLLAEKGLDPKLSASLIAAMKSRHHVVREFFHSGCGLSLQNLDGQMAEYVLKVMTVRKRIPCLPVHDSFIVPEGQTETLIRVMKEAYEKFVGKASSTVCSIKHSPRSSSAESMICLSQVHTFGSAPSEPFSLAPSTDRESRFQNPESSVRKAASSNLQNKSEPERPVIRCTPSMPSFLRRAQEQSARAWQEVEGRKQARTESRQSLRKARTDEEDGIGMRQREQSIPVPGVAHRYAEPPAAVPQTAVACANSRSPRPVGGAMLTSPICSFFA